MNGDNPEFYKIPENRELAAQYLLLYEMSLPYGLDLNNQINVRKSASQVMVNVKDISSKEVRELDAEAQSWLAENMTGISAPGTGLSVVFSHISGRNINSMLKGSITALVVISLILVFEANKFVSCGILRNGIRLTTRVFLISILSIGQDVSGSRSITHVRSNLRTRQEAIEERDLLRKSTKIKICILIFL